MSYPIKIFWGTVVILNFEFKIISVKKYLETFGQETIQGILFDIFSMESRVKLNVPDEDIQHSTIFVSIYNTDKEHISRYLWS